MSSVDDIDDEIVTPTVSSRFSKKSQSTAQPVPSTSPSPSTDLPIHTTKQSSLFSRLQAKIDEKRHFHPQSHDQPLSSLPTPQSLSSRPSSHHPPQPTPDHLTKGETGDPKDAIDLQSKYYTMPSVGSMPTLELELIRLVAFYKACLGDRFEATIRERLRSRAFHAQNNNQNNTQNTQQRRVQLELTMDHLPFMNMKHSHFPLFVQLTQVYRHIVTQLQTASGLPSGFNDISKPGFDVGSEMTDDVPGEAGNNANVNANVNANDENAVKSAVDGEKSVKSEVEIATDTPIASFATATATADVKSESTPTIDPKEPLTASTKVEIRELTENNPYLQTSTHSPIEPQINANRQKAMEMEQSIIKNIKTPQFSILSLFPTAKSILNLLILYSQYTSRAILQAINDKVNEQLEFEQLAMINWSQFALIETIKFSLTSPSNHTLPPPATSISELKSMFENLELTQRKMLEKEKKAVEDALKAKNMHDIDDIDENLDSYMSTSRSILDNDVNLTSRKRKVPNALKSGEFDDDENLELMTLSEVEKFGLGGDQDGVQVKSLHDENIMMSKCELCNQMIPIKDLTEHMRLEISNPDWRKSQQQLQLQRNKGVFDAAGAGSTNNVKTSGPPPPPPPPLQNIPPMPPMLQDSNSNAGMGLRGPSIKPPSHLPPPNQLQQHNQFLQQSGSNIPLPPGINMPGMNQMNQMGPNRMPMHQNAPFPLSINHMGVPLPPGVMSNAPINMTMPLPGQPPPQQAQSITVTLYDPTTQSSKSISVPSDRLITLEDEKPLANSQAPHIWERICLYEDNLNMHVFNINIPEVADQHQHNFVGKTVTLTTPSLRLSVGELRRIIQEEVLNKYAKRIKLNINEESRPNVFLNTDTASLAAYLLKHGYTIHVGVQKFAGKR